MEDVKMNTSTGWNRVDATSRSSFLICNHLTSAECSEVCKEYINSDTFHELGRLLEASHSKVRHHFEHGVESTDDVLLIMNTLIHYGYIEMRPLDDDVSSGDVAQKLRRTEGMHHDGKTGQRPRRTELAERSPASNENEEFKAQPCSSQNSPDCLGDNTFLALSEQAFELLGYKDVETQEVTETSETNATTSKDARSNEQELEGTECTSKGRYACSECGETFKRRRDLHRHVGTDTEFRPYLCRECRKTFRWSCELRKHKRSHSSEKSRACSICEKSFKVLGDLKRHMRTHTNERPYACSICEKSFTQSGDLIRHMRIHTQERPYLCSECGKVFKQNGHLQVHMRSHSDAKLFLCNECGKSYTRSSSLKEHMRIHSNERPFQCSECGKTFTRGSHLKVHMRIHSNERPFACNECGKAFNQSGSLKLHMKKNHSNDKETFCIV